MEAPQTIASKMPLVEYLTMRAFEQEIPKFYEVSKYVDSRCSISAREILEMIEELEESGLIVKSEKEKHYSITELGRQVMREACSMLGLDKL